MSWTRTAPRFLARIWFSLPTPSTNAIWPAGCHCRAATAAAAPERMKPAGRQPRLTLSRPWLATAGGGRMGRDRDRGGLERLLGEREQDLMRAAVALTGSRADGEDLLQAA